MEAARQVRGARDPGSMLCYIRMRSGLKVSRANLIIVKPGAVHGRLSRKEVNLVPAASLPPSGKVVMKPTQKIPEPRDGK